jgi:hypothetical protein
VYIAVTPLTSGTAFEEQLVANPPRFQLLIPPVGATDPVAPVTVAVNVIGAPKRCVTGVPTVVSVGIASGTATTSEIELIEV